MADIAKHFTVVSAATVNWAKSEAPAVNGAGASLFAVNGVMVSQFFPRAWTGNKKVPKVPLCLLGNKTMV